MYFIISEQYTITSAVLGHTDDSGTMEEGPTQQCEYLQVEITESLMGVIIPEL